MKVTERREARSDLVKSGPLNVPRVRNNWSRDKKIK